MTVDEFGLRLEFEPELQRLREISITKPTAVSLVYRPAGHDTRAINPDLVAPAFEHVLHTFGPSAGAYVQRKEDRPAANLTGRKSRSKRKTGPPTDSTSKSACRGGVFMLQYPGLSLRFPVSAEKEALFGAGELDLSKQLHGLFPDGSVPRMTSLAIHAGPDGRLGQALAPGPGRAGCYGEPVDVVPGRGLVFPWRKLVMKFGASAQDIIADFGPPDEVHYRVDDKMRIHSTAGTAKVRSDYFFNYFRLGLDVLFSSRTHTADKFIVHANQCGHFDFNRYFRCNFQIQVRGAGQPGGVDKVISKQPSAASDDSSIVFDSIDLDSPDVAAQPTPHGGALGAISPTTPWSEIERLLLNSVGKGVAYNREPAANSTNPYPSVMLHGCGPLVFEVMRSGQLASVTLVNDVAAK